MYRHILISTDGSDVAYEGVKHGLDLARQVGARVTIIAATESRALFVGQGAAWAYQEFVDVQRAAAERILEDIAEEARGKGLEADTVCVMNDSPADAIVEAANERGCDLIAMSSHGRRGLRRLVIGSVAAKVLALSAIPVLVVR